MSVRASQNMGLRTWPEVPDLFDHESLADNWARVDGHDHSSGRGVRLNTGSFAAEAITPEKVAEQILGRALPTLIPYTGELTWTPPTVIDTFKRAEENPLSNDGKAHPGAWASVFAGQTTGLITTEEWKPEEGGKFSAARYTLAEQLNPAISVFSFFGNKEIKLWTCANSTFTNGYRVEYQTTEVTRKLLIIKLFEGTETTLAGLGAKFTESVNWRLDAGSTIGVGVRNGLISVWVKPEAEAPFSKVLEVQDSSYNKGFVGLGGKSVKVGAPFLPSVSGVTEFRMGEMAGPGAFRSFANIPNTPSRTNPTLVILSVEFENTAGASQQIEIKVEGKIILTPQVSRSTDKVFSPIAFPVPANKSWEWKQLSGSEPVVNAIEVIL